MRAELRSITEVLLVIFLVAAVLTTVPSTVHLAHASTSQPSTFYFHRQSSKTINNVTTTLWANTTQSWSGSTQTEPRSGIRSGTPAVWHFYSQPEIAGNTTLTGPLTFNVYLASSAATGLGTVITGTVSQVTPGGLSIPLATASTTIPIGTTIAVYTFSINSNTYQITTGSILHFTLTVNIPNSSSRTLTLYYDTNTYRSSVTLTFEGRLGMISFAIYNQTGVQTGFYSRNWTATGRTVTLRTVLFDALGVYDINLVNTTIMSPRGSAFVANTALSRSQGTDQEYTGTWALNATYSSSDDSGVYVSSLLVTDNNGQTLTQQASFTLFATWKLDLRTMTAGPSSEPVPNVSVTVFSSGNPVYFGTSDSLGTVNPQSMLLRDNSTYSISSFWQGLLVNQTLSYVPSVSATLTLRLSIVRVDLAQVFRDGNGGVLDQPVTGLRLASPNGTTTTPNPLESYLLAYGTYTITKADVRGVNVASTPPITFNPRIVPVLVDLRVYDLTVVVVDQNGQPVSGAKVTLQLYGQTVEQGMTSSDGKLVSHDLPQGQYFLLVDREGQTSSTTVTLEQNTTNRIQIVPDASPNWIGQTLSWLILAGAGVSGLFGYRQFSKSRLGYREESIEYLNKLTGGFKDGEVVLINGPEGTGKTVLCEQLAYRSLLDGNQTVFLTYENAQEVRESMKAFHWDTTVYEAQHVFQLVDCEVPSPERGLGMLENYYDIAALSLNMSSALQTVSTKPRIFIDSLTDLLLKSNTTGVLNLVNETADRVKKLQGQLFITTSKSIPRYVLTRLGDVSDTVIELGQGIENGRPYNELVLRKNGGKRIENPLPLRFTVNSQKGVTFKVRRSGPKPEPTKTKEPNNVTLAVASPSSKSKAERS